MGPDKSNDLPAVSRSKRKQANPIRASTGRVDSLSLDKSPSPSGLLRPNPPKSEPDPAEIQTGIGHARSAVIEIGSDSDLPVNRPKYTSRLYKSYISTDSEDEDFDVPVARCHKRRTRNSLKAGTIDLTNLPASPRKSPIKKSVSHKNKSSSVSAHHRMAQGTPSRHEHNELQSDEDDDEFEWFEVSRLLTPADLRRRERQARTDQLNADASRSAHSQVLLRELRTTTAVHMGNAQNVHRAALTLTYKFDTTHDQLTSMLANLRQIPGLTASATLEL